MSNNSWSRKAARIARGVYERIYIARLLPLFVSETVEMLSMARARITLDNSVEEIDFQRGTRTRDWGQKKAGEKGGRKKENREKGKRGKGKKGPAFEGTRTRVLVVAEGTGTGGCAPASAG
jgi:hypothetical protein